MNLIFLILAHDQPADVADLARTLVLAANDAKVFIHFDARASVADFSILQAAVEDEPRIRIVKKRAACRWGAFGLVEAPLNALSQIEEEKLEPDYVMLLSGACLPCRPVAELERYLTENAGREFIEAEDGSWIGNGWRDERWQYRFWFDHKTQHPQEWLSFQIQRFLRIKRRFPKGLTPRFGSQWWALTWPTLKTILDDTRRNPRRLDFFRSVWIPDEMLFQSYVYAVVPKDTISGFGMTHFQFSNRGKPLVFFDEHAGYIRTLQRFFFRKISPCAKQLRRECLAIAGEADSGASLDRIGKVGAEYAIKVAAQTHYPVPGQCFFRDQFTDRSSSVLARCEAPYVVLVGAGAETRALAARMPGTEFTIFGEVFNPDEVDLGAGRDSFAGLRRTDAKIRDMHPALYLTRLRSRADGVPVLIWNPLHSSWLLEDVMRDPNAMVIAICASVTGDAKHDRRSLVTECLDLQLSKAVAGTIPGVSQERLREAEIDISVEEVLYTVGWLDTAVDPAKSRRESAPDIILHRDSSDGRKVPFDDVGLEAALRSCRFRNAAWFPALTDALLARTDNEPDRTNAQIRPLLENIK